MSPPGWLLVAAAVLALAAGWCANAEAALTLVTATGVAKLTCCQPEAVSPVKVAWANSVPVALQRLPTCVPVLVEAL